MRPETLRLMTSIWSVARKLGVNRTPLRLIRPKSVRIQLDDYVLEVPRLFFGRYAHGSYEPVTQTSFRRYLRPGMNVLDVGAHIGAFTMLASAIVGSGGRVHAIEPFDQSLFYLRRNLIHNHAHNVMVHAVAAGSENRIRYFHVTGSSDSNSFFSHPNTETLHTVEVMEKPLDEIVEGPVHAAKIDVEGAELLVLDGMKRILAENSPFILWVEWMPSCMRNAGFDPLALPEKLAELGFDRIEVLNDRNETTEGLEDVAERVRSGKLPANWYVNLLAIRER